MEVHQLLFQVEIPSSKSFQDIYSFCIDQIKKNLT